MSKYFDKFALKGLTKVGNIIIPGHGNLPSYEKSQGIQEIDRMIEYMSNDDRVGLKILLSLLSIVPNFLLRILLKFVFNHKKHPKLISPLTKMIMLGLKGVVMTTYYTEHARENSPNILSELEWIKSSESAVSDNELKSLIDSQDFNSSL